MEFLGVTLRLVQSLSSVNSALGGLIGSHVHLEKLIDIKNNNPDFDFEFKIVQMIKMQLLLKIYISVFLEVQIISMKI